MAMKLKTAYQDIKNKFQNAGLDSYALDARLLMCHILGLSHEAFVMQSDNDLTDENLSQINVLVEQRLKGRPVAKIIGKKEFYGRVFLTTEDTLDPRPDSEILIEVALRYAREETHILDLGTGTGCLLLTLLAEIPKSSGVAVDQSDRTLAVAKQNAENLHLEDRVTFLRSDWFARVEGEFDVIISNPPYIPSRDIPGLAPDVREYDPMAALDGGEDGLDPYRIIIPQSTDFLKLGGLLAFEVGIHQADDVADMMANHGFRDVRIIPDLAGIARVVRGIR